MIYVNFIRLGDIVQFFQRYYTIVATFICIFRWNIVNHYYFSILRVFHTYVSWLLFTGVWVTTSLLKFPGLFSVFWPISNSVVVLMVPTHPLISKSTSSCTNTLVTLPREQIIIMIVTFMFHSFFNSLAKSRYLSLFSHSFNFTLQSPQFCNFSYFLLIIIRSGCLAEIWLSFCILKSQWSWAVSFSRTDSGLCIYYLFVRSNFNLFHNSQWINLPIQSGLVLLLFTPWQFFTSVLADGLSLEFEWQQVSTSPQDSSQYSGRSQ